MLTTKTKNVILVSKSKGGFTVNERLLQLRLALGLTQDEFGARIGVSRSTICNYENGTRSPMAQTIRSICREFNVEYIWLTQGVGEMFRSADDDLTAMIDNILMGENETAKAIFRAFAKLEDEDWFVIKKIIDEIKK